MATTLTTTRTRACELCGASFPINPKYSQAQISRARFCSRSCAGKASPRPTIKPIEDCLGGRVRFGRLTFIGEGDPLQTSSRPIRRARFRCDCGQERDIQPTKVTAGFHQSCGCLAAEATSVRMTKHGGYLTPEYKSWNAMMQRCTNPRNTSYPDYGGRGITVCERWQGEDGYLNFVGDMGARPVGETLDRIKTDGNYEPSNTRWATKKVQSNNRRITRMITVDGERRPLSHWTAQMGFSKNTISERIRDGWPEHLAATLPKGSQKPR